MQNQPMTQDHVARPAGHLDDTESSPIRMNRRGQKRGRIIGRIDAHQAPQIGMRREEPRLHLVLSPGVLSRVESQVEVIEKTPRTL